MANRIINCPPKFDELNFPIWKVKMSLLLKSQGSKVPKSITNKFVEPDSEEDTWSDSIVKEYEANVNASYALM